jgi:hypothetical protein
VVCSSECVMEWRLSLSPHLTSPRHTLAVGTEASDVVKQCRSEVVMQ